MAKRITRFPHPWSVDEVNYLIQYRSTGMDFAAIAAQLGRTREAVWNKWERIMKATWVQPVPSLYARLRPFLAVSGFILFAATFLYLAATTPTV